MSLRFPPAVEAVVVLLVVGFSSWLLFDLVRNERAAQRGAAVAQADIARGEFHYHLRGLVRPWEERAIQIVQREYGIQITRTGGCVCSGQDGAYDLAYNRVVQDHFTRMIGFEPIDHAFKQAHLQWDKDRNTGNEL